MEDIYVPVNFIDSDGVLKKVQAKVGMSLLEVAHQNDVDLEGSCEGALACSTCHVIVVNQEEFDSLPEIEDEEEDMLDLAFELTELSRLGCQIMVSEDIRDFTFKVPSGTRNIKF